MRARWTKEQAWAWYARTPWVMSVNYVPSVTLHGMELWQADTHDEVMVGVKKELALMQDIGINSVRMSFPFPIWYHEREALPDRAEELVNEFGLYGVTVMPVIFNDCVNFGKPKDITPRLSQG